MTVEEVIKTTRKYSEELDVLSELDPELDEYKAVELWHMMDKELLND